MPAQLTTRPDGRTFISLRAVENADMVGVLNNAARSAAGPRYVHVDLDNQPLVSACRAAGFAAETVSRRYRVAFSAFESSRRTRRLSSPEVRLVPADQVDPSLLFRLDEALRQDVPGIDGWVGDRSMFDAEMASPAFDPTGYLVARLPDIGDLAGLIRIWHDDPTPALGLLGVLPPYRNGFLAHALLHAGLAGASRWGSSTFATHTARPSLQRRLESKGAECTGRFAQMRSS